MNPTQPEFVIVGEAVNGEKVYAAATTFLEAWNSEDYEKMYTLLTSISQAAITKEQFLHHYRSITTVAALEEIDFEILSVLVNPDSAQVQYRVTLKSRLAGDVTRDTLMPLRLEQGEWRVAWDDTLVLPELKGGNYLVMEGGSYVPPRANIYDRRGNALAAQADTTEVGFFPDRINPDQAEELFMRLTRLTGVEIETMRHQYLTAQKGADWYIFVGEVASDRTANEGNDLENIPGVEIKPSKSRRYVGNGIAPHVVGYVGMIQPDQVEEFTKKGYQQDDRIGQSGIERWGEPYLAGKRGGALYVYNAQGKRVTRLAKENSQSGQAIYTTLDRDFQKAAQEALSNFRGAIVVLERDTGRVLAMASSPGYDPNAFVPINANSSQQLNEYFNDPDKPLLNRAIQGLYPLGSVFKIMTMAAGIESGLYSHDTTYHCGYFFDELGGIRLNDWTYDYFLKNHSTQPSGLLTLSQGLIRSCNPYFWHIGLDLFNQGLTTTVSNMARGFGLGQVSGIVGLTDEPGYIPDPNSQADAVNIAIGQGDVLVTPLQVASFTAAIGNGGTLYLPQLVDKVAPPGGTPTMEFAPKELSKLPISPDTLMAIQQAMVGVITNQKPQGTAWHVFTGLDIPLAGKTGTAQSESDQPHAWFAGYTFAGRQDKPDIAAAVIVENAGEGSDYAAPIFRRIVELYFSGQPQKLYPWETFYNVTATPAPTEIATPVP